MQGGDGRYVQMLSDYRNLNHGNKAYLGRRLVKHGYASYSAFRRSTVRF